MWWNRPAYEYTLMPTHMRCMFQPEELAGMELAEPFSFTKGCPMLRIKGGYGIRTLGFPPRSLMEYGTLLYDTETDPGQEHPLEDKATEERMLRNMVRMMKENDAGRAVCKTRIGAVGLKEGLGIQIC